MGVIEAGDGLDPHLGRLGGGQQGAGVEHLAQASAGQVLEHQEGLPLLLAPVVALEDVRMVEGGDGPGLGPEPLEERFVGGQCRVKDLDGDPAMQRDVLGQEHVRGRTCAEGRNQSVAVAEDTPDGVGDARHRAVPRVPSGAPIGGGCHEIAGSTAPSVLAAPAGCPGIHLGACTCSRWGRIHLRRHDCETRGYPSRSEGGWTRRGRGESPALGGSSGP